MMDWLAIGRTLGHRAFAATTADANPVYDVTLLGLVSQPPRFVGPGGAGSPVQRGQLAVLPAADPQQEAHHVRLLLPPQLLDVLVRAHLGSPDGRRQRKALLKTLSVACVTMTSGMTILYCEDPKSCEPVPP